MIRTGLLALLALFALAFCAGQAQATCGDWLAEHEHPSAAQELSRPADPAPRCSGPSCQQSPPQEPRSPLTETIVVDKVGLVAESLTELSPDLRDLFARPVSDRWLPNLCRFLLERPPRC